MALTLQVQRPIHTQRHIRTFVNIRKRSLAGFGLGFFNSERRLERLVWRNPSATHQPAGNGGGGPF